METWDLEIIQVKDPWSFLARRKKSEGQFSDFEEMTDEMTQYLETALDRGEPAFRPIIGEVCAAKKRDGTWHRVCVESLDTSDSLKKLLKCYLIDLGVHQTININRFHKLPSKFKEFPAEVYNCRLWGIQPRAMGFGETETGLCVQYRPSDIWDSASVHYMNDKIQESSGCRGEIMKKGKDNSLSVCLYVKLGSDWLCFNDELVHLKYAIHNEGVENEYNNSSHVGAKGFNGDSRDKLDTTSSSGATALKSIDSAKQNKLSPLRATSFNSDSGNHSSVKSNRSENSDMPPLISSSDYEQIEKRRPFVQENLRNAKLLSPSKVDNTEEDLLLVAGRKNQNNFCSSNSSSFARKDNLSPKISSTLNPPEQHKIPTQARGRASLQQVLKCLRPGGLDSSSSRSPEDTSGTISKSAFSSLQQSSTPKSDATRPTVRFSDAEESSSISFKSHPSPSSPMSTNVQRNKVVDSNVQQNRISELQRQVQRAIDFDDQGEATAGHSSHSHALLSPVSKESSPSPHSGEGKATTLEDIGRTEDREAYLGKMEGQRLLQQLRQTSGLGLIDTVSALPATARPDKTEVYPNLGTLAYGKALPMALYSVMDVPFVPGVKKILTKILEREMAQGIEAYMWPAILAGRHVVGVSQPKLDNDMAYLPPLLSLITDKKDYMSITQRMGPLVLIVVPSWKRAQQVFDQVEKFTNSNIYENKQTRCIALYAAGTEECPKTETALIKGCEILVSTPGSLLRTVAQGSTSLKRVCHVVLDDADILSQHYGEEVSGIMQMYVSVVKSRQDITVPHQVLIFSKQWNDDVDYYRQHYTKDPVLSFSSRVEASVYGDVKQVVTLCRYEQRLTNLSKLIDSMATSGHKVIAWTSDVEEAKDMAKTIHSRGVYCLLVHHEMDSDHQIEDVRQAWFHSSHNKLVVLVATDQCYQDLAIRDATVVIHYDMPTRTRFGNRLACMMEYFSDRLTGIQCEIEPLSHVILTEASPTQARRFFDVLKRCNSNYPPTLNEFIKGYQSGLQTKWGDLCPFLKSFGYCLNEDRCEQRHVLNPKKDLWTGETKRDTLPTSGEVKVKVIQVVSANHFYCRLIEHRSLDNSHTRMKEDFQALTLDLALFYSKDTNHVPYLPPEDLSNAGLCGFKLDDVVHRARVVEVKDGTRREPMKQCKVWLVDFGFFKIGKIDQLVHLPPEQADVPYQAVEVFVCRIRPIDKEAEWTDRADIFVNDLVKDKILIGRIVLRLGMSMWLDPLVHQVKLKGVGLANDLVIRREILANNFAAPNPDHIQLLCELCRGKVDIPETVMQQYFDYCLEMELTQETLPCDEKFYQVNIAAAFSPGHFYIQKWENIERMDKLEAAIMEEMSANEHRQDQEKKSDATVTLEPGSVCLAKSLDGKWCRAKILSETEEHQWEVFFLDYGDREHIAQRLVRPLPREFAKLPCQAIECQMAHIKSPVGDWSVDTVDVMCDLSQYVNRESKQLSVKCISKTDSSHSLCQRLVVEVHGSNNVWFAEELVWRHLAVCVDENNETMKPLFNKPALKNQLFFNPWDKIPYLCANIYWAEDSMQSCALAIELKYLLLTRTEGWDSTLIERDLIVPLVEIIGYVSDPEAHWIILESLVTCCKDSSRFCEAAVTNNLVVSFSICLEQVSKSEIQLQAAKAVVALLTQPCFLCSVKSIGMETIFMDFLDSQSQSPLDIRLLGHVCRGLCVFIEQDRPFLGNHNEAILGHVLKSLKSVDKREGDMKPWLLLLSTLASTDCTSLHRKLMKESSLKLLIHLTKILQNSVCLSHIVMTFQFLIETNRKNKIILLEFGLQPVIRQMCDRLRSGPESVMCQQLLSSLTLQFPVQEGLAGRRIDQEMDSRICAPPVAWTETCFKVQLKVKVKNASVEDFEISSNNLKCSVLSEGTLFNLDWDLYSTVMPSKSRVEPYTSHTVISLRKLPQGKWGRLLKQKNKPPNLSPDFDYLYDSEEEEDVDNEDTPELTKKRKGIFEGLPSIHAQRLYSSEEEDSDGLAIYSNSDDGDPKIDHESVMRNSLNSLKK